MKVILYGEGQLAEKAYRYLCDTEEMGIVGLCRDQEADVVFAGGSYNAMELPEFSLEDTAVLLESGEADAVLLAMDNAWMSMAVRRLLAAGIYRICFLPYYYAEDEREIRATALSVVDIRNPRLEYLEYHVCWHCNLKCKACTHFSNLLEEEIFGDLAQYEKDLRRLKELFWGITKLRLMGGEPLLNPELPVFVRISREIFPDADIRVVSNGLLLREDMEELLVTMRECGVGFDISVYPPTEKLLPRIFAICKSYGTKLYVTPEVKEFRAFLDPSGKQDAAAVYRKCEARHCAFLGSGVISTCAMPQLIEEYNHCFSMSITAGTGDVIDLYEEGMQGIDLLERLRSPMEICRYCSRNHHVFRWEPAPAGKAVAADWFGEACGE